MSTGGFSGAAKAFSDAYGAVSEGVDDIKNTFLKLAAEAPARPATLSGQTNYQLFAMDPATSPLLIGDLDSVRKTKMLEEKRIKPYGFKQQRVLQKEMGWEFSFSAKLDGWELRYIMYCIEQSLSGINENFDANTQNGFANVPELARQQMFKIVEKTLYPDGSKDEYEYDRGTIVGYDEDVPDDNSPISYSLKIFCPRRRLVALKAVSPEAEDSIYKTLTDALNKISVDGNR